MKTVKVLRYLTWSFPLSLSTLLCACRGLCHLRCYTAPEELCGPGAGWLATSTWVTVKMLYVLQSFHDKPSGKWREGERRQTKWRLTATLVLHSQGWELFTALVSCWSQSLWWSSRGNDQLRFCGYPLYQLLEEALLGTKKTIFKNN